MLIAGRNEIVIEQTPPRTIKLDYEALALHDDNVSWDKFLGSQLVIVLHYTKSKPLRRLPLLLLKLAKAAIKVRRPGPCQLHRRHQACYVFESTRSRIESKGAVPHGSLSIKIFNRSHILEDTACSGGSGGPAHPRASPQKKFIHILMPG